MPAQRLTQQRDATLVALALNLFHRRHGQWPDGSKSWSPICSQTFRPIVSRRADSRYLLLRVSRWFIPSGQTDRTTAADGPMCPKINLQRSIATPSGPPLRRRNRMSAGTGFSGRHRTDVQAGCQIVLLECAALSAVRGPLLHNCLKQRWAKEYSKSPFATLPALRRGRPCLSPKTLACSSPSCPAASCRVRESVSSEGP